MAIRFLKQITQYQRRLIQRLVLNEDRAAIGWSPSHVIGLIPFCKENPKLQIEHRVNVWANMLVASENLTTSTMAWRMECPMGPEEDDIPQPHQTSTDSLISYFAAWVMHTLEVIEDGMPPQSYTLNFDGNPDLNHSTEAFTKPLKAAIAWLTLNTDCVKRGLFAPPGCHHYPFTTIDSAQCCVPFNERSSISQCNFSLDQPWDLEAIAKAPEIQRVESLDRIKNLTLLLEGHDCWNVSTSKLNWRDIRLEYFDLEEVRGFSE